MKWLVDEFKCVTVRLNVTVNVNVNKQKKEVQKMKIMEIEGPSSKNRPS